MFKVYGTCIETMKLVIYSRWGELMYEGTDPNEGWNGYYNSKLEDSAVFSWYLTYSLTTGTTGTKTGNVSLVR